MKTINLIFVLLMSTFLFGFLPIKTNIKDGHFRFENFKRVTSPNIELVHLMCYAKKPTSWTQPKQYQAGEHNLWVKAQISRANVPASEKHAYANFKVKLEQGKSYMLNRKISGDHISLWIQEVETGIGVSDVVVAQLQQPLIEERQLRLEQCRSGSI